MRYESVSYPAVRGILVYAVKDFWIFIRLERDEALLGNGGGVYRSSIELYEEKFKHVQCHAKMVYPFRSTGSQPDSKMC